MRTFAQKPKAAQQTTSAKSTIPGRAHFGQSREVRSILHLQRMIGNQVVQRLLEATTGDVTKDSMRNPEPKSQFTCTCGGGCPKCLAAQLGPDHELSHASFVQPYVAEGITVKPPIVDEALHSSDEPLDTPTRAFFEPRFRRDFSQVRVHHDKKGEDSARIINARAYTLGSHIVFGKGEYSPISPQGQKLLAHELTHVVQQSRTESLPQGGIAWRQAATPAAETDDFTLGKMWPTGVEYACSGGPSNAIAENSDEYKALQTSTNADIVFASTKCQLMTSKLKDATDALAAKVKAKWSTVKLKINSTYRNLIAEQLNYHKLARAADLATDPFDSGKLGHLAKLASESGFSWVYYEDNRHVHASVTKDA